jgi:uncharacterized membrane protein
MPETSVANLMLAYLCIKNSEYPYTVHILDRFGFSDLDIAAVCGCTVAEVRAARPNKRVQPTRFSVSKTKRASKAKNRNVNTDKSACRCYREMS